MNEKRKKLDKGHFFKGFEDITISKGFIGKDTGEVKYTKLAERVITCFLFSKIDQFRDKGLTFWQSYDTIAKTLGVHKETVAKTVRMLAEHGVIKVRKRKSDSGLVGNDYYWYDEDLTLVYTVLPGDISPTRKKEIQKAPVNQPSQYVDDELDVPF